ncbi:MAG TPA: RNA polymerase sigma factor [Polyangiaceae bacterium]|jgi:RNA polymerase sigma-70 factor (ECF subfamily)|nr:RNA polymerase sigma factor [Polyangiaceae bacterium]
MAQDPSTAEEEREITSSSHVRAHQPDLPTFEQVYQEYFPFVWRTARRMGIGEASLDDVCQDVFVAVHRRLPEFEGRSSLKTWMFGFVLNVVQVHHRTLRRKSVSHRANGEVVDPDTVEDLRSQGPDEKLSRQQAAEIAHELLDRLPEDKRAVFVLSELEGMSAAEIAEAVNANVNTVYARLRAARQQFSHAAERYRAKDRWRGG